MGYRNPIDIGLECSQNPAVGANGLLVSLLLRFVISFLEAYSLGLKP